MFGHGRVVMQSDHDRRRIPDTILVRVRHQGGERTAGSAHELIDLVLTRDGVILGVRILLDRTLAIEICERESAIETMGAHRLGESTIGGVRFLDHLGDGEDPYHAVHLAMVLSVMIDASISSAPLVLVGVIPLDP